MFVILKANRGDCGKRRHNTHVKRYSSEWASAVLLQLSMTSLIGTTLDPSMYWCPPASWSSSYTLSVLTGKDKPDRLRIMTHQINSWIRVVVQSCVLMDLVLRCIKSLSVAALRVLTVRCCLLLRLFKETWVRESVLLVMYLLPSHTQVRSIHTMSL